MPFQDYTTINGGNPPFQSPKPDTRVLSLLLKVIIMILLTTLFFVFLGLATALLLIHLCIASALHRRHRQQRHTQFSNSSSGFSSRDLKKLSQFRLSKPMSQFECSICLDGIKEGQWCRKLGGCGHIYHRKCVDAWLIKVSACPLCRNCVRSHEEEHQVNEFRGFGFGTQQSNWSVW